MAAAIRDQARSSTIQAPAPPAGQAGHEDVTRRRAAARPRAATMPQLRIGLSKPAVGPNSAPAAASTAAARKPPPYSPVTAFGATHRREAAPRPTRRAACPPPAGRPPREPDAPETIRSMSRGREPGAVEHPARRPRASGSWPRPQPTRDALGSKALPQAAHAGTGRARRARAPPPRPPARAPSPPRPARSRRAAGRTAAPPPRRPRRAGPARRSGRAGRAASGGISSTAPARARARTAARPPRPRRGRAASSGPASRWITVMFGPARLAGDGDLRRRGVGDALREQERRGRLRTLARGSRSSRSVNEAGPNAVASTTAVDPARSAPASRPRPGPCARRPRRASRAGSCGGASPGAPRPRDRARR